MCYLNTVRWIGFQKTSFNSYENKRHKGEKVMLVICKKENPNQPYFQLGKQYPLVTSSKDEYGTGTYEEPIWLSKNDTEHFEYHLFEDSAIEKHNELRKEYENTRKQLKELHLEFVEEMNHPLWREMVKITAKMSVLDDVIQKEVMEQGSHEKIIESFNRLDTCIIKKAIFEQLIDMGILK